MQKVLTIMIIGLFLSACSPNLSSKISDTRQIVQNIESTIKPQPTKITTNGLPDYHLIRTAFIPQSPEKNWDQPWQDACEEAAILTVYYYYQNQAPSTTDLIQQYQHLFRIEANNGWTHDINLSQMASLSTQLFNYQSKIIDQPNIIDIKEYLSQDIPIIIPAAGKLLYQENKHFRQGGPYYHNLVIMGYDDRHSQFIVHDVGTQFGAYYRYSYQLLLDSIHDFPPSNKKEDILNGDQKILVLLK